ncbi:MAG: hypothetical protein MRY83_24130, partial [Flavobacteriales bacterium]|nr:hypothetical protein [Flavobacteriales bacterium]
MRVDHTNIEEVLFDYVEGNLNHQQSTTLFEFLEKNPEYQGDLDAWQATIVNDDTAQYERAD